MRLLILENNLRERLGHFLNCTTGLAEAARGNSLFSSVEVFCHEQATAEVLAIVGASPIFSNLSWQRKRYLNSFRSMQRSAETFAQDCKKIGEIGADEVILVGTTLQNQIYGIALFLSSLPRGSRPTVVLNFHMDSMINSESQRAATAAAFRFLSVQCDSPPIVTAPTWELAREISLAAPSIAADCYPLPQDYGQRNPVAKRFRSNNVVTVVILGRSLRRKGCNKLFNIIRRTRRLKSRVRFKIQATPRAPLLIASALFPEVSLRTGGLSPSDYTDLLSSADIVLLPYCPVAYKDRTSGVFADCAAHGKVAIVPDGTWLARNISNENAAGVIYDPARDSSMLEAIDSAIENIDELKRLAHQRSDYWWRRQSAPAYIQRLSTDILARTESVNFPRVVSY
jgi:glycosyltransferase involved in cell wall biosynthesis